jgi:uncharacterized protein YxeA
MKKRFSNLIIFGILLAVCIFGALYFLHRQEPASIKEYTSSSKNIQTLNEPKADQELSNLAEKVTIKAYLHLGACGKEVTDLLDGLVREYQGRVSLEYIDFSTREGSKRMAEDGLNCQGLVINGKQTYTLKDRNGKQREVTFSHPINTQYTADDLKTVVKLLLGK